MGGLDTLTALEVLSVGNNLIGDLSSVLYLRPFKRLHAVNFAGNPLCQAQSGYTRRVPDKRAPSSPPHRLLLSIRLPLPIVPHQEAEYRPYALAHLPRVKYLDYRRVLWRDSAEMSPMRHGASHHNQRKMQTAADSPEPSHAAYLKAMAARMVDEQAVQAAKEQYQDRLQEMQEAEAAEEAAEAERQQRAERAAELAAANVGHVDAFRDEMLAEGGGDVGKLRQHASLLPLAQEFQAALNEAIDEYVATALEARVLPAPNALWPRPSPPLAPLAASLRPPFPHLIRSLPHQIGGLKREELSTFSEAFGEAKTEGTAEAQRQIAQYRHLVKRAQHDAGASGLTPSQLGAMQEANGALYEARRCKTVGVGVLRGLRGSRRCS